jgi:hypothetical protein
LHPFDTITDVLPNEPQYEKLDACCSIKCDEKYCNKMKSKSINKKSEIFFKLLLNYFAWMV